MRKSQGKRKDGVSKNVPTISGDDGDTEKESAVATKGDSNLEDRELAKDDQSETTNCKGEKQNECLEETEADEAAISILGGAGMER